MNRTTVQAEKVTESDLHKLVSSLWDLQHTRIILENRFRGTQNNTLIAYIESMSGKGSAEANIKLLIKGQVIQYPIHKWIISQKGLSYDLAGQLIGLIQDIKRFDNISKLWAYFGLAVVEVCQDCGMRYYPPNQRAEKIIKISKRLMEQYEKKKVKEGKTDFAKDATEMVCTCKDPHIKRVSQYKIKGALIDYNPRAKMVAYKVGIQFIKQGDFYRKLYDKFRAEYEMREDLKKEVLERKGKKTKTGESKGTAHIHIMARRKMVKIFLQHLWLIWRELESLSTSSPYVIDQLKHSDIITPPAPSPREIMAGQQAVATI